MWDDRYASSELVWSQGPNTWLHQWVTTNYPDDHQPKWALDVGAGEGRNALWLCDHGWSVDAVDFSQIAVDRMATLATQRFAYDVRKIERFRAHKQDVTIRTAPEDPPHLGYDLTLICFLHLPVLQRRQVFQQAIQATSAGGSILIIGHALDNYTDGVGGPANPDILFNPPDVVHDISWLDLGETVRVATAQLRQREVLNARKPALDTVVELVKKV